MNALPVIQRELRVQARHSLTYTLRMISVAALVAVVGYFGLEDQLVSGKGGEVFSWIHLTVLGGVGLLVPLSVADCLSRERREGTLGLLFLTPLRARDVVMAKGVAHGLRAVTTWAAVLPIGAVPVLLGGVGRAEAMLSVFGTFDALLIGLGAGIAASAFNKSSLGSLALTAVLTGACLCGLSVAHLHLVMMAVGQWLPGFQWPEWSNHLGWLGAALAFSADAGQLWKQIWQALPGSARACWLAAECATTLATVLFVWRLARIAAWRIERRWREEPSARAQRMEQVFGSPVVWRLPFRRWLRWNLDRNPVGWLAQRRWTGRIVAWAWCAVLMGFYGVTAGDRRLLLEESQRLHVALAGLLMLSLAAVSAASFRRERETGVLELLLVAPLNLWQIIGGRLRGVWRQFLPAMILLGAVWLYVGKYDSSVDANALLFYGITFLTLPVIGLYYSLARTNFINAFLRTLLVGLVLPLFLARTGEITDVLYWVLQSGVSPSWGGFWNVYLSAPVQVWLAALYAQNLHENLECRHFALERKPT